MKANDYKLYSVHVHVDYDGVIYASIHDSYDSAMTFAKDLRKLYENNNDHHVYVTPVSMGENFTYGRSDSKLIE